MEIKARYRNKVGKIIIEVFNGEKWIYVKTLSNPLNEFKAECLTKVSLNEAQNKEKQAQTFAQSLLNDTLKKDIPEDEMKKAYENREKLMREILGHD